MFEKQQRMQGGTLGRLPPQQHCLQVRICAFAMPKTVISQQALQG